jgi:DNA primase
LLHAQHHSIYIPNYLQAFDYPNADETPSPSQQQQDQADYRSNEAFDPFQWDWSQTTSVPPVQFLFETSVVNNETSTELSSTSTTAQPTSEATTTTTTVPTTSTTVDSTTTTEAESTVSNVTVPSTEQTTTQQNSTQAYTVPNTTVIQNETSNETVTAFSWTTESLSTQAQEEVNQTTETIFNITATMEMLSKNESDLIMNFLNQTRRSSSTFDRSENNAIADSSPSTESLVSTTDQFLNASFQSESLCQTSTARSCSLGRSGITSRSASSRTLSHAWTFMAAELQLLSSSTSDHQ